jgi:hypothetical protein
MKINITPRIKTLDPRLYELLRELAIQVNGLSEGKLVATYNAYTAAPTTGTWAKGDFIKNSEPSELGSASSKYVIIGWVCTDGGSPGTWLQCRVLTGN